jgi:hypothetical protein
MISKYYLPKYLSTLLKEKGFDLNCTALYVEDGVSTSGERSGYNKYHVFYNEHAAITWDQALDWFESRQIFISVNYAAPDTNAFSYRIDDYLPVNTCYRYETIDGKWGMVETGKLVGTYGITPTDENKNHVTYKTRFECYEQAILHAYNRI